MFAASKSGKPAGGTDPYFNSTVALLETTGTNGQQNNTFLDSSTNNFTITRTGTPTQGTFTPFSQTGWGGYFNGTNAYLTAPNNVAFNFGTGSVTVECWINLSAYTNSGSIIDFGNGATSARLLLFQSNTSGNISAWSGGSSFITSSSTVPLNTWTHVAFVRNGSACALYLNGVSVGTATNSNNWTDANCFIGTLNDNLTIFFSGYISNLRVVKGTAVYTAAFTPSTTPLTAVSGTSLLTLQSNRFKDNSSNNFAITATGTPSIQAFSPFAPAAAYSTSVVGGSGYFPGSSYLSIATNTAFNCGTGDFTVEAWVNISSYPGSYPLIIGNNNGSFSAGALVLTAQNFTSGGANKISLSAYDVNSGAATLAAASTNTFGSWSHIALVRNGTSLVLYINGSSSASITISAGVTFDWGKSGLLIGGGNWDAANSYYLGYISNLRLVKGTAVYTANFTPPTAPLTAVTNTSLLLNATNAGVFDATGKNDITTVGTAKVSNAIFKYGTGSMYFNGTTDYLLTPGSQNSEFGSGDFTIELWWYPTATSRQALYHGSFGTDWSIGIDYSSVSTNQKIGLWASSNGTGWNLVNSDSGGNGIGTTTVTQNAWNHIAFVRSGTTWMLFVNGNRDLNLTGISGSIVSRPTAQRAIGAWFTSVAIPTITGYIDDFRITKYARYTTAFTPPASAFLGS